MFRNRSLSRRIAFVVVLAIVYLFGYLHGHANLKIDKGFVPRLVNKELKKPATVDFSVFWEAYNSINNGFIETVDPAKAVDGAIKGMVESLGDPFSAYFNREKTKEFDDDLNGTFEGIGAKLEIKDGVLTVISPLSGTPAERAGIKPNDQIIKIDGVSSKDLTLYEAVDKIRGRKGTKVVLTVLPSGGKELKDYTIVRDHIKADSVELKKLEKGVAKLSIYQFGSDTSRLMEKYVKKLAAEKPKGILLDLRNNPGGLLDSSIDTASYFLKPGTVVLYEKDRRSELRAKKTTEKPLLKGVPTVVMINGGSASAAEIVAGALKDNKAAEVVGERSFGKGSVQSIIELSTGATIHLTTQKWYTPNKINISQSGISPDVEVKDDPKTEADEVQNRALEVLKKMIKQVE